MDATAGLRQDGQRNKHRHLKLNAAGDSSLLQLKTKLTNNGYARQVDDIAGKQEPFLAMVK